MGPLLSQLHLSLFTGPTQLAKIYLSSVSQKQKLWQQLLQAHREIERRNLPFSWSTSACLMRGVPQQFLAKDPFDYRWNYYWKKSQLYQLYCFHTWTCFLT
jgi:hypothetical protein